MFLPDDGKRKKAVVQQSILMPWLNHGGFEQIKAAVPLCPHQRSDDHALKITAALGGNRHEARTAST